MPVFSLGTLRGLALDRLDGNSTLFTNPELDYIINEAIQVTALNTGFFRSTSSVTTVANQLEYSTPTGMLLPFLISTNGRLIQQTSLRRLARTRRNWATATTANYGQTEYWAAVGVGTFVMSPIDSTGGNTLTVTGLGIPPLLVAAADVMVLENEYVEAITSYCAHRLPLKIGGPAFANGSLDLNEFYEKMNDRKRYESLEMPKYRLLAARPQQEG